MFWKNGKKLKAIRKRLIKQQSTIESYIQGLAGDTRSRIEWCTVHQRECKSTGLLMWEKDMDSRYTFLNTRHCNDFFHMSLADVRDAIGKTDPELIANFVKRTGLKHTFGDVCITTDKFTLEAKKPCRFWEIGYIGNHIFILDVTKTPLYQGDVIIGLQSWALNQSTKECEYKSLLEMFIESGEAKRLNPDNTKIASYLIKKKDNPFNGVFPK